MQEITEEDNYDGNMNELMEFVHESAINSLRLLLRFGEKTITKRELWNKYHLNLWEINELEDEGYIMWEDECSYLICYDTIEEYLKKSASENSAQTKLAII